MNRDVAALTEKEHDLVVVGGGIFGVCAAWDAALRGLSVALVERDDFAHATSANCFKIVHGGIRYLQHGDIYRVRESSHERTVLLRIAPHLVNPLPIVVPTYGRGTRGREVLRAGMALYDLLTFDRNRGISDPARRIPASRVISRQECLEAFPGLESQGLTGGMLFHDGHMYSPPRLALAFLKSAVDAGARALNYVEAVSFLRNGNRVAGVAAVDRLTGDRLEIRGKVTLCATGAWAEGLLRKGSGINLAPEPTFSRDAALVINRRLSGDRAVAVQGQTRDPDAILSRGNRHLFMAPWRDYTLVGVWHLVYRGDPDGFTVTEEDVQGFLDEFNASYALSQPLTLRDVSMSNAGLVLFGENEAAAANLSYGKRSLMVDHARNDGVDGLITVVGVRYTTARGVGEKAVSLALRKLGRRAAPSATATTPLYGGDVDRFDRLCRDAVDRRPEGVSPEAMHGLARNHGSAYGEVLRHLDEVPAWREPLGDSAVIKAEVVHAVRHEMARKLADVVFRRTDLGSGGHPGEEALRSCAELMAADLQWDPDRIQRELAEARAAFPSFAMASV